MDQLIIFNCILLCIISAALFFTKRHAKNDKRKNGILLFSAILTILCHYSSFLFLLFSGGDATAYLKSNPNLLLPIYPCNVVMWSALIFALLKNKRSKLANYFVDYLFWFGIFSTLVGMFANVDFITNPTLADYENVKSIGAHATLLFNVLLLCVFGYIKMDFVRNITNILISIVKMAIIGGYCNLLYAVIDSAEAAYEVNSMFLIHSPFEGVDFLTYPIIVLMVLPIYLTVFIICDCLTHKKGSRFIDKLFNKKGSTKM